MNRFSSIDSAVRWWLSVSTERTTIIRGSGVWESLRGQWADRCARKKCDSKKHHAVYSKRDRADVERCFKCGEPWRTKGKGTGIQRNPWANPAADALATFASIGAAIKRIPRQRARLYVAHLGLGVTALAMRETREGRGISVSELRTILNEVRNQLAWDLRALLGDAEGGT